MTTLASDSARRLASLTESLQQIEHAVAHANHQQALQREQDALFEEELRMSYDVNSLLSEADTGRRILETKEDEIDYLHRELGRTQTQLNEVREESAYLSSCLRTEESEEAARCANTVIRLGERVDSEENTIRAVWQEVDVSREALRTLHDAIDAAYLVRDKSRTEVDDLEREHQEMRNILARTQQKMDTLKQESSYLKYELGRQKEALSLAESDLEIALKKLHQLEGECERLTKGNFSLKQDISLLGEQDSYADISND